MNLEKTLLAILKTTALTVFFFGTSSRFIGFASAEEEATVVAQEEFVVPGLIAGQGNFTGSVAINTASNEQHLSGQPNIISGGLVREDRGGCKVTVKNTSPINTYAIRYEVRQRGRRNQVRVIGKARPTLKPGATDQRTVRCEQKSAVGVFLISGKKVD